jgi:parallel beta-helix repeat protein
VSTFGIRIQGASNLTVDANTVIGAALAGIVLSSASDIQVVANHCKSNQNEGILVTGASADVTVSNNHCQSNAYSGISFVTTPGPASVAGNTCVTNGLAGILIYETSNVVAAANVCKNNGQTQAQSNYYNGITLWSSGATVANCVVIGNRCFDDQATKTQQYGIRTLNPVDNCTFGQNLVEGNGTTGLSFSSGANTGGTTSLPYRKLAGQTVGTSQTAIPHGLPYVPNSIQVTMTSDGNIWRSAPSDATNIYLTADATNRTADVLVG